MYNARLSLSNLVRHYQNLNRQAPENIDYKRLQEHCSQGLTDYNWYQDERYIRELITKDAGNVQALSLLSDLESVNLKEREIAHKKICNLSPTPGHLTSCANFYFYKLNQIEAAERFYQQALRS